LSFTSSIFAEPTKQSLIKQQQQIEAQKNSLNENMQKSNLSFQDAQKEIATITSQIQSLDFKIEGLNTNISDSNAKIAAKVIEIKAAETKLAKNSADLVEEQDLYNARMRSMYIEGPIEGITILLASKSLDDFFSNLEAVKCLSKLDKQITKDLADTKTSIIETKASLETQNALLVTANNELQDKLTQLKTSKSQQSVLIAEAKSRQAFYATQITGYKAKIDAANKQALDTEKQIKALALKEQSAINSISPPATTNALVAYAYKFMGTPYVWGGTLPSPGFDCSGFLQYVYAHFGIHITRTTYTQINEGKPVSRDQLQPGDLIFFGTYENPHHVAMYVGNNCFIHAPQTGDFIKISSLTDTDFLCARRILN
jgi:cell wall-associated NlpC family hydrolase